MRTAAPGTDGMPDMLRDGPGGMIGADCILPPGVLAAALRKAFPTYAVTVSTWRDVAHYELVTLDDSNPWCLISDNPREIWNELTGNLRTTNGLSADV
jgi:hypothetical protein